MKTNKVFFNTEYRKSDVNEDGLKTAEFVISDETVDRHGTVIPVSNWKTDNYKKNPIVGYQHEVHGSFFGGSDPDDIIGKGEVFVEDNKLIGRVTFVPKEVNPKADKIAEHVKLGTLTSTSVGFIETSKGEKRTIEIEGKSQEVYHYGEVELLEF